MDDFNKKDLPKYTIILMLGIASIILSFSLWGWLSLFGLICALITLVLVRNSMIEYRKDPDSYSEKSLKFIIIGKRCAYVGLILSFIIFLIVIVILS